MPKINFVDVYKCMKVEIVLEILYYFILNRSADFINCSIKLKQVPYLTGKQRRTKLEMKIFFSGTKSSTMSEEIKNIRD